MRLATLVLALCFGCVTHRVETSALSGDEASLPAEQRALASMNGKYAGLLATLKLPEDAKQYGNLHDYGYWPGGTYAGVSGLPAGYWVYVAPTWYLWERVSGP